MTRKNERRDPPMGGSSFPFSCQPAPGSEQKEALCDKKRVKENMHEECNL